MKAVVVLDDLELAEGNRVVGGTTVTIGWDGEWFELDLTDEHAADLWGGLQPYLKAARRIEGKRQVLPPAVESGRERAAIQAAEADPSIPRYGRVVLYHAVGITTREYWRKFREWCASNGYVLKQYDDKTYSYPVDLVEEYERHLSLLDRRDQAS